MINDIKPQMIKGINKFITIFIGFDIVLSKYDSAIDKLNVSIVFKPKYKCTEKAKNDNFKKMLSLLHEL